ncbi:MAG: beta-lactamase family protein [Candidatus Eremiobacteraeota bacterium]|nr:beta-lactamase family protein [Candidatus Eremiobacteraeota bacterium]
MKRVALCTLLSLLTVGANAPDAPAPFPSTLITSTIQKQLDDTMALAISVAIVRNGSIIYQRAFGVKDRERKLPAGIHTRFEIGSITKQFTAAAILQLKEQGRLSLDDRLVKYVPEFPHADELTLRQLLNQTSGLFEFMQTNHFIAMARTPGNFKRIEGLVRAPLHFAPGTQWEYSNTNYIALGRVVEIVSGQPFEKYVRQHLFMKAGMGESSTIDHEARIKDMARSYWRGRKNDQPLAPAPPLGGTWAGPAGFIVSSAGDLAKWDVALQSGKIISASDFALMTTPPTLGNGRAGDYGMGWWIDKVREHQRFDHDGDTFGFSSSNWIFPGDDLCIIVLQNEPNDAAARSARKIFDTLYPAT